MEPKIERFFLELPEHKRQKAMELRDIVLKSDSSVKEDIKWNQLTFVCNGNLAFLYNYPGKEYMNFGFFHATSLMDADNDFEGTGKSMRHIKVYPDKSLNISKIRSWIKQAIEYNMQSKVAAKKTSK